MPGKDAGEKKMLRHEIKTRVNDQKFNELNDLLAKSGFKTMSELIRNILHNRPVKVYTVDESIPLIMEELSGIRKELKSMGININQVTHYFNSTQDSSKKLFHSFEIDKHFQAVGTRVQEVFAIISKLSERWLQE